MPSDTSPYESTEVASSTSHDSDSYFLDSSHSDYLHDSDMQYKYFDDGYHYPLTFKEQEIPSSEYYDHYNDLYDHNTHPAYLSLNLQEDTPFEAHSSFQPYIDSPSPSSSPPGSHAPVYLNARHFLLHVSTTSL